MTRIIDIVTSQERGWKMTTSVFGNRITKERTNAVKFLTKVIFPLNKIWSCPLTSLILVVLIPISSMTPEKPRLPNPSLVPSQLPDQGFRRRPTRVLLVQWAQSNSWDPVLLSRPTLYDRRKRPGWYRYWSSDSLLSQTQGQWLLEKPHRQDQFLLHNEIKIGRTPMASTATNIGTNANSKFLIIFMSFFWKEWLYDDRYSS